MSQYPGSPPPGGPYYPPPPADPYAQAPMPPVDPYFGQPVDPYAQQASYPAWPQPSPYPPGQPTYQQPGPWQAPAPPTEASRGRSGGGAAVLGLLLILFGAWILFRDQLDVDLGAAWPAIVVGFGVLMIVGAFIPRRRR